MLKVEVDLYYLEPKVLCCLKTTIPAGDENDDDLRISILEKLKKSVKEIKFQSKSKTRDLQKRSFNVLILATTPCRCSSSMHSNVLDVVVLVAKGP